ncbi:hypothetical protein BCR43DRAFT_497632 [Syncephalastrum racemosum]|uniref:Uncharacterized protein n=1 Tax=Syncephalastrum racemosum TaxID=13706 RepID=A0A1X2H2K0_SYNRA|nr:hypothetical protein BCR43DRAFT_497632 [Syncephalastrum racemosum]
MGFLSSKRKRIDECPSPRDGPRATDYHFGGRTAKRHSPPFFKKSINDKNLYKEDIGSFCIQFLPLFYYSISYAL